MHKLYTKYPPPLPPPTHARTKVMKRLASTSPSASSSSSTIVDNLEGNGAAEEVLSALSDQLERAEDGLLAGASEVVHPQAVPYIALVVWHRQKTRPTPNAAVHSRRLVQLLPKLPLPAFSQRVARCGVTAGSFFSAHSIVSF